MMCLLKTKSLFIFLFCILFFSCSTISYYVPLNTPNDYSVPADNLRIQEQGMLQYLSAKSTGFIRKRLESVVPEQNQIICQGELNSDFSPVAAEIFGEYYRDYQWLGAIRFSDGKATEIRVQHRVYADSDGRARFKRIQYGKKLNGNGYQFEFSALANNYKGFDFPVPVASFTQGSEKYTIVAVYEDAWELRNQKEGQIPRTLKVELINRIIRSGQKYQILNSEGKLVAELLNDKYILYNTPQTLPPESHGAIKLHIAVLYVFIRSSEALLKSDSWKLDG